MGERYSFEDVWRIPVSREIAWRMVDDVANWPSWWPDYRLAGGRVGNPPWRRREVDIDGASPP
jgi:hypothetical protein